MERLRTDRIDIYQMHHVDRDCPWEETWTAFGSLINQGKVVYVGSSNFAGWDIATACHEAAWLRMLGLVSEQSIYHLDNRAIELEVIPGLPSLWLGADPLEPLGRRLAGRRAGKGARWGGAANPGLIARVEEKRSQLEAYESALPRDWRAAGRGRFGLAAA